MLQIPEVKIMLRLLSVTGLSVMVLCGLTLFDTPLTAGASLPALKPRGQIEAVEPFTPAGRFVAALTPTNEWNEEIPLVASSILDNQGVIFATSKKSA